MRGCEGGEVSLTPTFQGEVQFRRYSDTSTQGAQIVLSVSSREDLEPFIGKEGKRFMAVLVEIGDDELPVTAPAPEKSKLGPKAYWLVLRCKEPDFQKWVWHAGNFRHDMDEQACAEIVKGWCGVESRADIDGDPKAEALFEKHIRGPWAVCQALFGSVSP